MYNLNKNYIIGCCISARHEKVSHDYWMMTLQNNHRDSFSPLFILFTLELLFSKHGLTHVLSMYTTDIHMVTCKYEVHNNVFVSLVQVSDNGIISLERSFLFWQPSLFPTGNQFIQAANVFAAYWADVDNRVEGENELLFFLV